MIIPGANLFTGAAPDLARRTGLPPVVIGATVVSLATTLPELSVSVYSAVKGLPGIAVGNVVGSSIFNLGAILGVAALICPMAAGTGGLRREGLSLLAAGALFALVAGDGSVSRLEGLALLAVLAWYVRGAAAAKGTPAPSSGRAPLARFLLGAAAVIGGSRLVVDAAADLARRFGIPEVIVGLTIVAAGTSLPEFVTAVVCGLRGKSDLGLGNLIGATLLNLTLVTGGAALARPLSVSPAGLRLDILFLFAVAGVALAAGMRGLVGRGTGLVLVAAYLLYLLLRLGPGLRL